jgi:hypothetical protein
MTAWFEVDRGGLRQLLAQRGVAFVLYELVSNAWDAPGTTQVTITLTPVPGEAQAELTVVDDAPGGFTRLEHAWTLFAASERKGHSDQRGRFNLGEKLVLAMCDRAEVVSTTGGVRFDAAGRHPLRRRRTAGSEFVGRLRLTRAQLAEIEAAVPRLIPPAGVRASYNGRPLVAPPTVAGFAATLPTEVADAADGLLRRTRRQTEVVAYAPGAAGAWLCELGIPVVATELPWTIDVQQKVPLTLERTNVSGSFLRELRVVLFNVLYQQLPAAQLTAPWVREAGAAPAAAPVAVKSVLTRRFGPQAVAYDPSDPEGSKLSVVAGRPVIHGGTLSAGEWENARRASVLPPAGQVTPSPRVLQGPDGVPPVPPAEWEPAWQARARETERLGRAVLGFAPIVQFQRVPGVGGAALAWYGDGIITFQAGNLGAAWFARPLTDPTVLALILHEFAHEEVADHLSMEYQYECCRLGAVLAVACSSDPSWLAAGGEDLGGGRVS